LIAIVQPVGNTNVTTNHHKGTEMESQEFASRAEFIAQVAYEASEEPDAIEQHPEIIDMPSSRH